MKIITLTLLALLITGGIYLAIQQNAYDNELSGNANNVKIVDGNQIITITAKGGYSPKISTAKADTPNIIRMKTKGSFDCSSFLVIPSIGYQKALPLSGETDISLPPQRAGTTLLGMCGMGMYRFEIKFS